MNTLLKNVAAIGLTVFAMAATLGQAAKSDISSVVAAGTVTGNTYTNAYFGVSISAQAAKFTAPELVTVEGQRARLANIVSDSPEGAKNYTVGILADSLENYPKGMLTNVYVRSVRHQLERDGLLPPERPNFGYRRGISATFLNGYVFSLQVQARDEERIQQVLSTAVKIATRRNP